MNKQQLYTAGAALLATTALAGAALCRPGVSIPGVRSGPAYAPPDARTGFMPMIFRDGNDGGGGGGALDPNDPKVKALVDAAVDKATAALKANNADLKKEKENQKKAMDELTEKLSALDGIDIGAFKDFASKHKTEEYAALFKAGRFSDVIDREVAKAVAKVQKEVERLTAEVATHQKAASESTAALKTERIRNKVAGSVKEFNEGALEDIQRTALDMFDMDEAGQYVLREGVAARTKDGKPVTLETLNAYLLETRPYYFKGSQGGGGKGGGGGGQGGGNDGVLRILSTDKDAINKHRSQIADGKAIVVDP